MGRANSCCAAPVTERKERAKEKKAIPGVKSGERHSENDRTKTNSKHTSKKIQYGRGRRKSTGTQCTLNAQSCDNDRVHRDSNK